MGIYGDRRNYGFGESIRTATGGFFVSSFVFMSSSGYWSFNCSMAVFSRNMTA